MQLRTYTNLWNVEKRLYKIYDWALPYPVSVKQLGFALGSGIPWIWLLNMLGVSGPTWLWLYIAVPLGVTMMANRPVAEGKTATSWLGSQLKFHFGPKTYTGLSPELYEPGTQTHVSGKAWSRL